MDFSFSFAFFVYGMWIREPGLDPANTWSVGIKSTVGKGGYNWKSMALWAGRLSMRLPFCSSACFHTRDESVCVFRVGGDVFFPLVSSSSVCLHLTVMA